MRGRGKRRDRPSRGDRSGVGPAQASLSLETTHPLLDEGERWARSRGHSFVVGVDEVGRGPLAGPVVAAAVWLHGTLGRRLMEEGIDDSKRLSPRRREELATLVEAEAQVGIGLIEAARIDEINILRASLEAMREAVLSLAAKMARGGARPDLLLVDGTAYIRPDPLPGVRQQVLVKGDRRSISIASASVVAKVHRDALMTRYDEIYPGYGFRSHKGYLSAMHREALARLGPCPIHRRSFRGVAPPCRKTAETA